MAARKLTLAVVLAGARAVNLQIGTESEFKPHVDPAAFFKNVTRGINAVKSVMPFLIHQSGELKSNRARTHADHVSVLGSHAASRLAYFQEAVKHPWYDPIYEDARQSIKKTLSQGIDVYDSRVTTHYKTDLKEHLQRAWTQLSDGLEKTGMKKAFFPHMSLAVLNLENASETQAKSNNFQAGALDMAEMFKLMQEMVSHLKEDEFLKTFLTLENEYQKAGEQFAGKLHKNSLQFASQNMDVNSTAVVQGNVVQWFRVQSRIVHSFIQDLNAKVEDFAKSMPTASLRAKVTSVLQPIIENVTKIIELEASGSFAEDGVALNTTEFCNKVSPIMMNASQGSKELLKFAGIVNNTHRMIPLVGRMVKQMLPADDPDAEDIAPRVMLLEENLLNVAAASIDSMTSVMTDINQVIGTKIADTVHCQVSHAVDRQWPFVGLVFVAWSVLRS